MSNNEVFEDLREHAFRVAYQMVGSAADAEDLVQETWIRWHRTDQQSIRSPGAWITTVVTRLAMNHLASARVRREQYVGTWLPEPIPTDSAESVTGTAELNRSLSVAFMFLLESLSPKERAVFLLHEVFGLPHAEVADVVDVTEAASRKLLQRARVQLRARRPRFEAAADTRRRLLESFRAASQDGDLDRLAELLAADVVAHTDGGGRARAALRPIYGRDRVARFVRGAVERFVPDGVESRITSMNGEPALVASAHGTVLSVISVEVSDSLIQSLFIVTNPDKLRAVTMPDSSV
ncbi:MAG: RNA polymerase sigma-70 factor [Longimicrobiales bacterium]